MKPKTITDILSGFGVYARWYGFDEAMGTKGKHTSSEPEEVLAETVAQIQQLINERIATLEQSLKEDNQ